MTLRCSGAFAIAVAASCFAGSGAQAQDTAQSVYEAAKKEGKVVYWSSNFTETNKMVIGGSPDRVATELEEAIRTLRMTKSIMRLPGLCTAAATA